MASTLLLVLLAGVSATFAANQRVFVCYYGSWAYSRPGLGRFSVDNIDPDLCTHLIYAFVGINSEGTVHSLDPGFDFAENGGSDNFRKFTALKNKNPNLKTLLAVGGYNEESANYSIMAGDPKLRQNFIQSGLKLVRDYNFDGFDVDWEYPARRDSVHGNEDINNFSQLLKEIREEFDKYGLLVTAAVSAVEEMAVLSYDIPTISQYLHFIHVMTYDLHGPWDPTTGHNAALHAGDNDDGLDPKTLYTVDVAVEFWLRAGCPPEKLVMGIPLYGHTFFLANATDNGVKSPVTGAGISGPYTGEAGVIAYNEFCVELKNSSWSVSHDQKAKVPYAYRGVDWVSFDYPASIAAKVQFAKQNKLGGIMVWSIESDDFHDVCGGGRYPLLTTIKNQLRSC